MNVFKTYKQFNVNKIVERLLKNKIDVKIVV